MNAISKVEMDSHFVSLYERNKHNFYRWNSNERAELDEYLNLEVSSKGNHKNGSVPLSYMQTSENLMKPPSFSKTNFQVFVCSILLFVLTLNHFIVRF